MNKLNQFFKSIQIKQIVTVFIVGVVLLISTACSSSDSAQAANSREGYFSQNRVYESQENPDYDAYDANQKKKPEAGFNQYEDDPRNDNPNVRGKAERLIQGAKANIQKSDSGKEYAEEFSKTGEVLGKFAKDDRERFSNFKDDLAKGVEQRLDTTKSNLDKASTDIKRAGEDVSDAVDYKTDDIGKTARRTAEDAIDNVR